MKSRKLIIIASLLIVVGLLLSILTIALNQFNFEDLDDSLISKTYDINEEFDSIDAELNVSEFNIYLSNDGTNKALCLEKEKITFTVNVENNTLIIKENNTEKISIGFNKTEVSLFLNKNTYNSLNIKTDTGDIDLSDAFTFKNIIIDGDTCDISVMSKVDENLNIVVTTGDVSLYRLNTKNLTIETSTGKIDIIESFINNNANLKASTGKITLESNTINNDLSIKLSTGDANIKYTTCNSANIKTSTGDCNLENFIASGDIIINTDTGDIELDGADAVNFYITTDTGDIEGTILSDKIFNISTNTGKKNVPETYKGGIFKVTTDTGDIIISYE